MDRHPSAWRPFPLRGKNDQKIRRRAGAWPNAAELRILGESLGQFIYLLDAGMDLKDDLKQERYNPLATMIHLDLEPLLTMLLAQGAGAVERLPLQIDRELIENIIYSGVWSKFRQWREREKAAAKGEEQPTS